MWLIVGLGNPGPKYSETRHNVGFMVLDHWAQQQSLLGEKNEHKAITAKFKFHDEDILICKPLTFMNLSGQAIGPLMSYYKIPLEKLVVVYDEIDLPFGAMKYLKNRSAGGHNGMKDIIQVLGTQDFMRVRFGVGRPSHPGMDVADYVLQKFAKDEQKVLPDLLDHCAKGIEEIILNGLEKAATNFNRKAMELR